MRQEFGCTRPTAACCRVTGGLRFDLTVWTSARLVEVNGGKAGSRGSGMLQGKTTEAVASWKLPGRGSHEEAQVPKWSCVRRTVIKGALLPHPARPHHQGPAVRSVDRQKEGSLSQISVSKPHNLCSCFQQCSTAPEDLVRPSSNPFPPAACRRACTLLFASRLISTAVARVQTSRAGYRLS
jgi:hypothetical protein